MTPTPIEKRIQQLKKVHEVQGTDGNWNSSRYMRGLFNGLELGLAIMEDREPSYRDVPDNGHTHETDNRDFNRALSALLNEHGYDSRCNMHDFLLSEYLHHVLVGLQYIVEKRKELSPKQTEDDIGIPDKIILSEEDRSLYEGTKALHEWKENNPPDQYKPGEVVEVQMSDTV